MAESKLTEALAELQAQHQEQIRICEEKIRETFSSKQENTHVSVDMNSPVVDVAGLQQMCMRLEDMSSQLSQLQKQKQKQLAAYEALVQDKHLEVAEMRQCLQTHQDKYQELLYMKLALDLEVAAYRKALEGQEQRLGLSLSPLPVCITVVLPSNPDTIDDTGKAASSVSDGTITCIAQQASDRACLSIDQGGKCIHFNKADQCSAVSVDKRSGRLRVADPTAPSLTQNSWGN